MKLAIVAVILIAVCGSATAANISVRVTEAVAEACLGNCANQAESCKRVCPVTFGAPCLSACDSQAQTCRAACQPR